MQPEKVTFLSRLAQSRPLYEAFKALKEGPEWGKLPEARRRIVEHELRDFVLGGVALEVRHVLCASAWTRLISMLAVR